MPKTRMVDDPHSFIINLSVNNKFVGPLKAWVAYRSRQEKLAECKAKVEAWFAASMGMTVEQWRQAQAANAARLELSKVMAVWARAASSVRTPLRYDPTCDCNLCSYVRLLSTPKARTDQ